MFLNNLVSNALQYTQNGEIVLAAETTATQVALIVRDTGAGITAADLPYVFDRFYRADTSRHRSTHAGSGLGLAIAKAIVEAHGGTLAVTSVEQQGITFTLTFNIAEK